jgi:hypothetical protein
MDFTTGHGCSHWGARSTLSFLSCPRGWSQTIPQAKKPEVEALGWRGYMWSAVVRPIGRTTKFSKMTLESYGREMNICSQHANCTLPQNLRHLWHCVVYSGLLLSPAPVRWMDYLGKGEMLTK